MIWVFIKPQLLSEKKEKKIEHSKPYAGQDVEYC